MLGRIPVALLLLLAACNRLSGANDGNIDALPQLAVEEQLRIGDVNDPDIGFSFITGVDVDRDGNVFVVEGAVPEIRVHGPDGAFVRRFGRRGAGPGEFQGAPRVGVIGDTVWAIEQSGVTRLALFDRQGALLATGRTEGVRVQLPSGQGSIRPWLMRPDGRFASHFSMITYSRNDPPSGVKETDSIPFPHVLFDVSGNVTDTVGWADRPPPGMWRPTSQSEPRLDPIDIGGRRFFAPRPPPAIPWWEPLRDGYLLVEAPPAVTEQDGLITVARIGLRGDTAFRRELRYRPTRWTPEDLDSIAGRAARGEAGGMVPIMAVRGGSAPAVPDDWQAIASRLRDAMDFPTFKPPLVSVWLGQDESIWLRRRTDDGAPASWVVLDSRGNPVGQLELRAGSRPLWVGENVLWAAVPDENDVQWLVRYRIRAG